MNVCTVSPCENSEVAVCEYAKAREVCRVSSSLSLPYCLEKGPLTELEASSSLRLGWLTSEPSGFTPSALR